MLEQNEAPNHSYDWNEKYLRRQQHVSRHRHQNRQQISDNMSDESLVFNQKDIEEDDEMHLNEYEIGSLSNSLKNANDFAQENNLDKKMKAMQGYNFKYNQNFQAMKKIV